MSLTPDGPWFKDEYGRICHLRGVNLAGTSKLPVRPDGATYRKDGFYEHRDVSFVGRPFPLEEADEHFKRLQSWGLTLLRLLVTWEAIEHSGPGIYDEDYLAYITQIVEKAGEYGMVVFIDPHQDVWSRFSGGDGAPGWTFEKVGIDLTRLYETGAAIPHNLIGDPYPRMLWPTNEYKLAAATLFTLFFGGDDFAPQVQVDGIPVQGYLQTHYINAVKQVAARVKNMPHVIGYDTFNEPSPGYIGWQDLTRYEPILRVGPAPTPYQSMLLGAGYTQTVDLAEGPLPIFVTGKTTIDPQGNGLWLEGYECIWKRHGVWDDANGQPRLLRPDYFASVNGRAVNFENDYLRPFVERYTEAVRSVHPDTLIFIEAPYNTPPPDMTDSQLTGLVHVPHWYNGLSLQTKRHTPHFTVDVDTMQPVVGRDNVRRAIANSLEKSKNWTQEFIGEAPTVIGEIGIAMDMHNKSAYSTGDYSAQIQAMDELINGLESNLLDFTLWNYTPDNTNARGDLWNDEDLSIFSRDQQSDPRDINSGGRALEAVVRPYAKATAGIPLRHAYDVKTRTFTYAFQHDPAVEEPTEFFVPNYAYPGGYRVEVSDGLYEIEAEKQLVRYWHTQKDIPHLVRILSLEQPEQKSPMKPWVVGLLLALLALALLSRPKKRS